MVQSTCERVSLPKCVGKNVHLNSIMAWKANAIKQRIMQRNMELF